MTIDYKKQCVVEGCPNLGEWNKRIGERIYRRKLCIKHHNPKKYREHSKKYSKNNQAGRLKERLRKKGLLSKCAICSWDKAFCDLHRIVPGRKGGTYKKSNVVVVCPNCHRLLDYGIQIEEVYDKRFN